MKTSTVISIGLFAASLFPVYGTTDSEPFIPAFNGKNDAELIACRWFPVCTQEIPAHHAQADEASEAKA